MVCELTARTRPKSAIFTAPCAEISTFSGLTSRCTRPAACAAPEGAEQRLQDRHRHRDRQRALLPEQVAQRAAVDQFHHEEHQVAVAALVVDGDDAGVAQRRGEPCLPLEAAQERRVGDVLRAHHLDRDRALQSQVDAAVHGGHPAAGDQPAEPVPAVEHGAARQAGERVHNVRV